MHDVVAIHATLRNIDTQVLAVAGMAAWVGVSLPMVESSTRWVFRRGGGNSLAGALVIALVPDAWFARLSAAASKVPLRSFSHRKFLPKQGPKTGTRGFCSIRRRRSFHVPRAWRTSTPTWAYRRHPRLHHVPRSLRCLQRKLRSGAMKHDQPLKPCLPVWGWGRLAHVIIRPFAEECLGL